jgi:RimJ/RimL family protein N-acetyltransferase
VQPTRLDRRDEAAVEELLHADPVLNLFLLGFLAVHPMDRAWWYGVGDDRIEGVVLVLPGRLAVPFCPQIEHAYALGELLRQLHRPTMMVGPRAETDAIWSAWARRQRPVRRYDQRLYVLDQAPGGLDVPGFRRARLTDLEQVATHASAMEREDLGVDPADESATAHVQTVKDRLQSGRTWVIDEQGAIVFQVNVGTTSRLGCQIGGTYVPPEVRGRGLATAGVEATCRRLLARYPRVTLHVNEANTPAVRVYERCGFQPSAPMRLLTVRGTP